MCNSKELASYKNDCISRDFRNKVLPKSSPFWMEVFCSEKYLAHFAVPLLIIYNVILDPSLGLWSVCKESGLRIRWSLCRVCGHKPLRNAGSSQGGGAVSLWGPSRGKHSFCPQFLDLGSVSQINDLSTLVAQIQILKYRLRSWPLLIWFVCRRRSPGVKAYPKRMLK